MSSTEEIVSSSEVVLTARGLCKRYPGVRALQSVDLKVCAGEIHALLGQNGAGKSTLVRILAGAESPDEGRVIVGDEELKPGAPEASAAQGIAYVSQEGNLNQTFTVPENVFLGRELKRVGLVDYRGMREAVRQLLEEYELELNLDCSVAELDPAKRKLAEIVRALAFNPRVIILDEPTAALPRPEIEHLLDIVRRLAARGIGVIFISHYLEEVFSAATKVTVLRDGCQVWTGETDSVDADYLVGLMVGQQMAVEHPQRPTTVPGEPLLEVRGLSTVDHRVKEANLNVRRGQVLGIFGVVGAGKSELLEALFGMRALEGGEIVVAGQTICVWDPRRAISAGLALLPEERLEKALLPERSIAWNLSVPYWRNWKITWRSLGVAGPEARIGQSVVPALGIQPADPSATVATLSGGNKQKVSIGRWIGEHAKANVFLFDEPTQGLDVGARAEVYRMIRELTEKGAGVILASSELNEVLGISHEVVAMRVGETVPVADDELTAESVLAKAT